MSSAVYKAWSKDGVRDMTYGIPWGAVRKLGLHYQDVLLAVTKLTLNGVVYNIQKQSKEGLVIVGNAYESVSFVLPDYRDQISEDEITTLSIYDYLFKLGDTEYSVIPAWDYFASFVAEVLSGMVEQADSDSDPESEAILGVTAMPYMLQAGTDGQSQTRLSGIADFTTINTAKDFFHTLRENLDSDSVALGQTIPVSSAVCEDGSVLISLIFDLGENEDGSSVMLDFPMYIGVK